MSWKKLGMTFNVEAHKPVWLKSHAMMPLALEVGDRLRIYYTGRHNDGRSRISFVDVDKDDPSRILYVHDQALLEPGRMGTFDDCGTVGTFVMKKDNLVYLYYNGYNVRNTVPWSNSIGLAVSRDEGRTFTKMFEGPVMDRNITDPYFAITPCILVDQGTWHMWYTSGTGWLEVGKRVEPLYNIKYATSTDGINWTRRNEVSIPQANEEECVARATVLREGDRLRMWLIYRGSRDFRDGVDSYRIGYAEGSIKEPTRWVRRDELAGIEPGPEVYDNLMQSYANVIRTSAGRTYMFYNGNDFGHAGFACAVMQNAPA